jgi:hypothetical protein
LTPIADWRQIDRGKTKKRYNSSLHLINVAQPRGEMNLGWHQERLRDESEKNSQKPDDNAIRVKYRFG